MSRKSISPWLRQECTISFRIRQIYQTFFPSENWDHANIQVDGQDMYLFFLWFLLQGEI